MYAEIDAENNSQILFDIICILLLKSKLCVQLTGSHDMWWLSHMVIWPRDHEIMNCDIHFCSQLHSIKSWVISSTFSSLHISQDGEWYNSMHNFNYFPTFCIMAIMSLLCRLLHKCCFKKNNIMNYTHGSIYLIWKQCFR